MTFTNGHYSLLMRNWAAHHKKLGLLYVVIALDEEALQLCFEHGINSMTWSENLISGYILAVICTICIEKGDLC
jgi:hypothetical protein